VRRSLIGGSIGAVAIVAGLGLAVSSAPAGAATAPPPSGAPASGTNQTAGAGGGTGTTSGTGTSSASVPATDGRPWLEHALSRRQATLSRLTASVEQSHALSTAVRQTLESQLAAETSGIDGLATAVPSEPTATLRSTAATMVDQYRVYLVMVPKVRIAETAGRQQAAEQRATHLETVISTRIAAAQKAGHTVAQAQSAYQDLVSQVSKASSDTSAAGSVLAVQPSGYPGNAGTISAARADLRSARSTVPAIREDLRTIRSSLRGS
jgi:hypothetical protein